MNRSILAAIIACSVAVLASCDKINGVLFHPLDETYSGPVQSPNKILDYKISGIKLGDTLADAKKILQDSGYRIYEEQPKGYQYNYSRAFSAGFPKGVISTNRPTNISVITRVWGTYKNRVAAITITMDGSHGNIGLGKPTYSENRRPGFERRTDVLTSVYSGDDARLPIESTERFQKCNPGAGAFSGGPYVDHCAFPKHTRPYAVTEYIRDTNKTEMSLVIPEGWSPGV